MNSSNNTPPISTVIKMEISGVKANTSLKRDSCSTPTLVNSERFTASERIVRHRSNDDLASTRVKRQLFQSTPVITTSSRQYPQVAISLFIESINSGRSVDNLRETTEESTLVKSRDCDSIENALVNKHDASDPSEENEPLPSTSKLTQPGPPPSYRPRLFPNTSAAPAPYTSRYSMAALKTNSIYSGLSTPNNLISSPTSFGNLTGTPNGQFDQFTASTSIALQQCENEILCHYNRFLTFIGWRPFPMNLLSRAELNCLSSFFNWLYLCGIFLLLFASYFMQFVSCYRHDNLQPYILLQHEEDLFSSPGGDSNKTVINYQMVSLANPGEGPKEGRFQWWMRQELEGFHDSITSTTTKIPNVNQAEASNTTLISFSNFYEVERRFYDLLQVIYDRYYNVTLHNGELVSAHHQHKHLYQCRGGVFIYYFVPSVLHFLAFISVLRYVRLPEADRFHNLCVLSYLIVTKVYGREKSRLMLKQIIRNWLLFCGFALVASIVSNALHLFVIDSICFTFMQPETDVAILQLKGISMFLFSLNDFVCIAIVTMYSLHCELNIMFLKANEIALRQKRIDFHEFTKNTEESKINIDFLNECISTGLSILLIHFSTRLIVSLIDLFSRVLYLESNSTILSIYSLFLWFSLVVISLVQAARVTDACSSMRHIGHELRARPFCYQSAAYHDLDSLLNYTSSLHLKAKILMIPVRASCVAALLLVFTFALLIAGQLSVRNNF